MTEANHSFSGFVELGSQTLLQFSGSDRLRYLNGQVTNNVSNGTLTEAIYACVTDAKGKLQADIYIRELPDERYLIDASPEVRESLALRLDRYIIADDVELEDVTEEYVVFHTMDTDVPEFDSAVWTGSCARYGNGGTDIIAPVAVADSIRAQLIESIGKADPDEIEAIRIKNGFPAWGKELIEGMLPPEAQIEDRAINYEKGCYIGQEVISRIKSVGRVNRLLCQLQTIEGNASESTPLFAKGTEGKAKSVGEITSTTGSGDAQICLGYLKRDHANPGTELSSDEDGEQFSVKVLG